MPYRFSFEIAGIRFDVTSCDPLRLPQPWTTYRPFVLTDDSRPPPDWLVRLHVTVAKAPDVSRFPSVFESESWVLHRAGAVYWLALAPGPHLKRPPWVAQLSADFLSGEIFCDPDLVRDYGNVGVMFNPVLHRLDQLIAMHILSDHGGGIVHGTGVAAEIGGVIFAGRSGAGKTTLARLLAGAPNATTWKLLSDDRIVVREWTSSDWRMFGTPWAGEAQIAANVWAPLRGLAFLKHGSADRLEPLTASEAAAELLPVLSVPWYDAQCVVHMTDFCHRLVSHIPAWRFEFAPTSNVWKLAREIFQSLEK